MFHQLFPDLQLPDVAKDDLVRRMNSSERHYHDMRHLDVLWHRHRIYRTPARLAPAFDRLIAYAIAYHDAVYVAGANDNEERSALLWLDVSRDLRDLDLPSRLWVAEAIRSTSDHLRIAATIDLDDPHDFARQWLLDLDLSPLGEPAAIFDRNTGHLFDEMTHLSPDARRAALRTTMRRFLAADALYRCAPLRTEFEAPAKENLRRHLDA